MSTSCPKSIMMLSKDSIRFDNRYFSNAIKYLMEKTSSRIELVNMTSQKILKLDICFYPKRDYELKACRDTLIDILKNKFKFSIYTDYVLSKAYSTTHNTR
jgi:hypothetical protein